MRTSRTGPGCRRWTSRRPRRRYRLTAELPGLTKEDINITLENNVLRLSGERKFEKDVKKESYHRIERTYGAFSRSFALPQQVSSDKVQAAFENGVLTSRCRRPSRRGRARSPSADERFEILP